MVLSNSSPTAGSPDETADGVYSNWLELIDSSDVGAYDASETGLDRVLRVELGGGTGGIKNDAGVRWDVVTLLSDRDEVDIGEGSGDALMLETVVELRLDTDETEVDLGNTVPRELIVRGVDSLLLGVEIGLDTIDLLARDMVLD